MDGLLLNNVNKKYKELIKFVLDGEEVFTRNSKVMRNLNFMVTFDKTPLVSLRRAGWQNSLREWEWFMSGSNNINDLDERVQKWWKPWASETGTIHNNYGSQFRAFEGYNEEQGHTDYWDQIEGLIKGIKKHPMSRRNVITTWHTYDMNQSITPVTNCHGSLIQCFVDKSNKLHMTMVQRSADVIIGVPHNIFQYWAFLTWLAYRTDKKVGTFTWTGTDLHIYEEHYDLAQEILEATDEKDIPELVYTPTSEEFKAEDFTLDRKYIPVIKKSAKMVV